MLDARILVVEDETIVAMDIADVLRRVGYTVVEIASSGAGAIRAATEHRPDLVLMDIRLQGTMDGIEAAGVISRSLSIPIIFLTAHADEGTVDRSKGVAPHGYLLKPFEEQELIRAAELALTRHRAEQQELERSAEALWQSEERFRRLVDAVEDYAIILLDLSGRVVSWNPGAERLSGYAEEEVVGQPLTFLYADELRDPERFRRELDSVRATGRRVEDGWRIRKNGTRLYVRSVRTPVLDRKGRICGFAVFTHDVTEHQALEAQLLQAQKLESLGTLAGGIAHDFNNMLMVISSRAELLLRLLGTVDPYRRFIEDIQKATGKSRNLTQQLLAAARRQVLQPSVTNVNEVVKSSLELLSPTLGEHILINSELSEPLWSVYADPGKLHQVLLNLAINARDAMSAGGTLTIETRNLRVDAAYARQHPGLLAGEYVALIVSDTGTGIPAEIRERIYDPFFSTKALGSGLGMAVVRGIIEQTGGFIWLYSEEGKGTTFKIVLPRHVDVAAGVAPTEAEALPEYGVETILLVEDEQLLRTVLRETLEEHGYTVIDARSPAEALAVTAPVHLLLTDVVMPGMNGPTLAAKLVAQRPELRVVFMSGYTDDAISHHGVLDHGVYFLEKPSTTAGLLRTIRAALSDE